MTKSKKGLNYFQNTFEKILDKAICAKQDSLISEMLTKRFSEEGIRVSKKTIRKMAQQLRDGATEVEFENQNNPDLQIRVSDKEIERVQTEFNKWLRRNERKINKLYRDSVNDMAGFVLKTVRRGMTGHVKYLTDKRTRFQNRLQRIWKTPFNLLEMYIAYVEELTTECYNEHITNEEEKDDLVFEVLFRLQSRAIRIAQEILVLIKSERYLAHDAVEYCKGAEQFQIYAKSLKQKVIPKREMIKIRKERDDAVAAY